MKDLSQRFLNGLKQYNIKLGDIKGKWKYCGGEEGRHLNYFNLVCVGEETPNHEKLCICGHKIKENCYITDGTYILTLGNCCIKRFVIDNTRTCEKCGTIHRNRKDNLCINCRGKMYRYYGNYNIDFN